MKEWGILNFSSLKITFGNNSNFISQYRSNESIESSVKTSMESILNRNDVSEGSTTEDYATCTDNSKRAPQAHVPGIRYVSTSKGTLFTASQIPG